MKTIIFVCHGSICRSPAAAFMARKYLKELGREDEFIVPLRKAMDEDFEKGFLTIVRQQYDYLRKAKGDDIYPLTIDCAKYYLGV